MRRWGCAVLLAAWLGIGASAHAAPIPERCERRFGTDVLALVCDPVGGSGGAFSIQADGAGASGRAATGMARLRGNEAFHTGERIRFDLTGGSGSTVAAFEVATLDGIRRVVVEPFDPPARHYDVHVHDAVARVSANDGRGRTIRFLSPVPDVSSSTPGAAVRSFVRLIDLERLAAAEAACGLLSDDTRTAFGADGSCPATLGWVLLDQEAEPYYPEPFSMSVRRVRIVRRHPTIASVEMLYRFRGRPLRVWATVALLREDGGWRIALPEKLSPRDAIRDDTRLTVRQVRRHLVAYQRAAHRVRAREAQRQAASRPLVSGTTACPGEVRSASDASRDLTLADGDLARRQDEAGVDLIGASQSHSGPRVCFELRFRTPLAARASFVLSLTQRFPIRDRPLWADRVWIDVDGSSAVAFRDVVTAGLGPPFFPPEVRISPTRDALSVDVRGSRGWPAIDTRRPYGWAVEVWSPVVTGDNAYLDDLQP